MKIALASLAAIAALTAVVPAAAHSWPNEGRYYHDDHRGRVDAGYIDRLAWRINHAAREGRISWEHARYLRHELREARALAWRVEAGQASGWEYRRLSRMVDRIEAATGGYGRGGYPRYGYNDRR